VLVLGGLGLFGLSYVRMTRAVDMERMAAEQALMEATRQRDEAEAARTRAEAAAAAELEARKQAGEDEQKPAKPKTKLDEGESREKQP